MTRMHSNFTDFLIHETIRVINAFNSSIQNETDESFTYIVPERLDKFSNPQLLASLNVETRLALETLNKIQ